MNNTKPTTKEIEIVKKLFNLSKKLHSTYYEMLEKIVTKQVSTILLDTGKFEELELFSDNIMDICFDLLGLKFVEYYDTEDDSEVFSADWFIDVWLLSDTAEEFVEFCLSEDEEVVKRANDKINKSYGCILASEEEK